MHKIAYMEWVKTRPRSKYEIGGSGVVPVRIEELPEAREAFDINDFNLYGYRPLVQAVADRYRVDPDQVVTTQGTSMANYLAIASVVSAGDEVIVESPAYSPLLDIPNLLGCKVKRLERHFRDRFRIDLNGLSRLITKKTKLIILTNPHNPSGALAPEEVLREVGELAAEAGAYVLVDEVYMDFVFDNRPPSAVHIGPHFLVSCSLTKVYGFDGLRCGWVLGRAKECKTMWRLQDFFGVNGAIPAEKTSVVAFRHLDRFQQRTRGILDRNRPLVEEFMDAHSDQLKWVPPDAGPVCFPKMIEGYASDFCDRLRAQYDVGVIPGHYFEMPKHFRVGFGGDTEELKAGLQRLSQALADEAARS